MNKIYFTLTGTKYYYGKDFLKAGMEIQLEKDPENEYDKEAIKVIMKPLGQIGSVANSPYTVLGDCMSAGRIYDKIGKKAKAKIVMVTDHGVICKICKKSLIDQPVKLDVSIEVKPELQETIEDELSFV